MDTRSIYQSQLHFSVSTNRKIILNHLFPIWPCKLQQYLTFPQVTTVNSRQNTKTKKQNQTHKDLKVLESGQMQMIVKGSWHLGQGTSTGWVPIFMAFNGKAGINLNHAQWLKHPWKFYSPYGLKNQRTEFRVTTGVYVQKGESWRGRTWHSAHRVCPTPWLTPVLCMWDRLWLRIKE